MTNDIPNQPLPPPPPVGPAAPPSMVQMWVDAVTKPYQRTYAAIANLPRASATNAFLWVFIAALVQFFVSFLVSGATQRNIMRDFGGGQNLPTPAFGVQVLSLICGAPIAAVVAVLFFALFVGIMHLIARAFGGRATYDQLAYAIAAITVPFNLIGAVLSLLTAIPLLGLCFGILAIALGIYAIVLEVIAVMGVEQIGAGGAMVSTLVLPIVVCLCVACAVIVGLAAFAPVIGNVFSSINQSLPGIP